jgi:hypothetical protein
MNGRNLDARTRFLYMATVNTPAMAAKMAGKGSQYALNSADSTGATLHGANNYRLNIPANTPAKDFWSVVVYDPQTRSAADVAAVSKQEQQARHADRQRGRIGRSVLWTGRAGRQRGQLARNGSG